MKLIFVVGLLASALFVVSVERVSAAPAKNPCVNTVCPSGMKCKALGPVGFASNLLALKRE